MDTETVAVPEQVEVVQEVSQESMNQEPMANDTQVLENNDVAQTEEPDKEQNVPLSALQKERRKRQDAESELKMYREHQLKQMQGNNPQEEDESQYEPVTKAELSKYKDQMVRDVDEKTWIRQNPEKAEIINEKLAKFLKLRPNLAAAIEAAPNRYEEAWDLLDKLSPKQKAVLNSSQATKKIAPNSPSGIPKAAAINQTVEFSSMTDKEFNAWRDSKRKRR